MPELNESIKDIPIPPRMLGRPISDQGFPIPWFVPYTREGVPIPQASDEMKRTRAARVGLCWCCGGSLGVHKAYVIGPMCMVNRVTCEPASHRSCALYAVKVCPYLTRPRMKRNPVMPAPGGKKPPPGFMIERNPGVCLVWVTRTFRPFLDPASGGILYSLGDPEELLFFAEGRRATRAEILESFESGLPILRGKAAEGGPQGLAALGRAVEAARPMIPPD